MSEEFHPDDCKCEHCKPAETRQPCNGSIAESNHLAKDVTAGRPSDDCFEGHAKGCRKLAHLNGTQAWACVPECPTRGSSKVCAGPFVDAKDCPVHDPRRTGEDSNGK